MAALQEVFVGIDISKDRLDVHVRPLGVGFSVSNEAAGHAALIARLRPLRAKRIVLEATGGYERALWLASFTQPGSTTRENRLTIRRSGVPCTWSSTGQC